MPEFPPEDRSDIVQEQADKLVQLAHEQTAFMSISRAVQAIERIDDLEHVVRVLFDQMKIIGLDLAGLAFQRLIDAETQTFEKYHMRPDGVYQKDVELRPTSFREWQPQQVLYRRDILLPEYRLGLPDDYRPAYLDLGLHIRSILHVPNRYGILTLRSETPHAFSEAQVNVVRDLAEMLGLAISRVEDLERLAEQNVKLAWANADLKAEIAERKRAEAKLVEAERLRVLVETAGAAAHAINQPLTAIIGLAELLMREQRSNSFSRNELNDILHAGMKISDILKKMQNIRQYATRQYVGDVEIVDFDAASGIVGDDSTKK